MRQPDENLEEEVSELSESRNNTKRMPGWLLISLVGLLLIGLVFLACWVLLDQPRDSGLSQPGGPSWKYSDIN